MNNEEEENRKREYNIERKSIHQRERNVIKSTKAMAPKFRDYIRYLLGDPDDIGDYKKERERQQKREWTYRNKEKVRETQRLYREKKKAERENEKDDSK